MKRHERCSISGSFGVSEIPLLSSFLYLFGKMESESMTHDFSIKSMVLDHGRSTPKTFSGREFDWGGTSVKW